MRINPENGNLEFAPIVTFVIFIVAIVYLLVQFGILD